MGDGSGVYGVVASSDAPTAEPAGNEAVVGRHLSRTAWVAGAVLSAGVALVSYRYVAGVGPVPPNVAQNRYLDPWIVVHAGAAATALLGGPSQFAPVVRRRWPRLHRWAGRAYVVGCMVGGASALVLAAGVSSGPVAGAGFAALGLQWMYATGQGWATARARRYADHRRWMIRSFALTFAAVTLRLYLAVVRHARLRSRQRLPRHRLAGLGAECPPGGAVHRQDGPTRIGRPAPIARERPLASAVSRGCRRAASAR